MGEERRRGGAGIWRRRGGGGEGDAVEWSVEEGEEEGGLLPLGRRLVAGDNDLFFAWLPAYE